MRLLVAEVESLTTDGFERNYDRGGAKPHVAHHHHSRVA